MRKVVFIFKERGGGRFLEGKLVYEETCWNEREGWEVKKRRRRTSQDTSTV